MAIHNAIQGFPLKRGCCRSNESKFVSQKEKFAIYNWLKLIYKWQMWKLRSL